MTQPEVTLVIREKLVDLAHKEVCFCKVVYWYIIKHPCELKLSNTPWVDHIVHSLIWLYTASLEPVVEVGPIRVEEPVGHTVIFTCEVSGPGPFNVVWTRANRQPLPSRANTNSRYTLTIRDLVQTDSGQYICTATNIHGSTRGIVTLQVTGNAKHFRA